MRSIIISLIVLALAFYLIKRGSVIQKEPQISQIKRKKGIGDLLVVLGALFIVSPILASFIASIVAALLKMDPDTGFVWGMLFGMSAAPLGVVFVIIGFIINLFRKKEVPTTNSTNPTATPTTTN